MTTVKKIVKDFNYDQIIHPIALLRTFPIYILVTKKLISNIVK